MTRIHPLPPYLNRIAEYAVDNMIKNGYNPSECLSTSVKIKIFEQQVIFSQRVTKIKEKADIDCWDIFPLSKLMLDDPMRPFSRLKVTVSFQKGKISTIDYRIYQEDNKE